MKKDMLPGDSAFPTSLPEQGRLEAPEEVTTEGARINQSLADGTYGNQPNQTGQAGGGVTVVAPSPMIEGPYGASGEDWLQTNWDHNPESLRRDLQLDNLRSLATQRKIEIENAPIKNALNNRLAEARIAATGAHDRFLQHQDAQALEATHGFLSDLMSEDAPQPGDADYHGHVLGSLLRNKRFAMTTGGAKLLDSIAGGHDIGQSIEQLTAQLPEGMKVKSVRAGGGKTSYITAQPADPDAELAKELKGGYGGLTLDQVRNAVGMKVGKFGQGSLFTGDHTGDVVQLQKGDKRVYMSTKAFERFGGQYGPETLAARKGSQPTPTPAAAGKHLGSYNPATGEFEN